MTEAGGTRADLRDGRITSIRAQKKTADRVSIFLDGQFAFGIHRDVLLEFELVRGADLSVAQQISILERDAYFRARAVALRFIAFRERTSEEIRRRLRRAEYSDSVIEDVVEHLRDAGLVDDRRFAAAYAEARFRSRGYGPNRIRAELRKKGISPVDIGAAIDSLQAANDEVLERAREIGATRWDRLHNESDLLKRKKKVYDYLCRRGFSFDTVRVVVDELAETAR